MAPERILIVDRDPKMIGLLREVLAGAGYAVLTAAKGEQAISRSANEQPALVILDVELPGEVDGFEAVRRIREFSDVPIVALSACGESEIMLRAFALGVDDYVFKPFDPRILLARVGAVLKRCRGRIQEPAEIRCSNLVINLAARQVTVDGIVVHLTETEYNLLLELARHRNRVLMHDHLLRAVWGAEFRGELAYLRSYVHILRRKLEADPAQPRLIISRPGIGYMLVTTPSEASGE